MGDDEEIVVGVFVDVRGGDDSVQGREDGWSVAAEGAGEDWGLEGSVSNAGEYGDSLVIGLGNGA